MKKLHDFIITRPHQGPRPNFKVVNRTDLRNLFDGTLQKYRWQCGFPNHHLDSHVQWTHVSGICYASNFNEFLNTVNFQLLINYYPTQLTINFEKVE